MSPEAEALAKSFAARRAKNNLSAAPVLAEPTRAEKSLTANAGQKRNRAVGDGEVRESTQTAEPTCADEDGRHSRGGAQTFQKPQRSLPLPHGTGREDEPLPESPEIEKALLCALLYHPEQGFSLFEQSGRPGFFGPVAREWFIAMRSFYREKGNLNPVVFMQNVLDNPALFEKIGGHLYFVGLQGEIHPSESIPHFLAELREKYVRRQIIVRSFALAGKARNEDLPDLLLDMSRSVEDLQSASATKLTLCDATNYLNGDCPPMPPEIIYGLLHQGSKMIVGGTSKGRKTMALIDAAVSVVSGSEWWGYRCRRGPICYINFEIQDAFFWYRVNQVCEAKGVNISPGMFYAWNLRGRCDGIENLREEILRVLKQKPFVFIIIDPIYKALGDRDENRAGDVASMLNEVEKIAVETGAAVAFGAHYSKGNQSMKESIDRIGGSGVFARDPDTILTMTAHEEEECFTVEGTLRNFPPMRPFVIKWDWPLFVRAEGDPNKLKKARGTAGQFETKFPNTLLLDQLSIANGLQPKEACSRLKESHDVSRRTVYNMKAELEEAKLLEVKDGLWYKMPGQIE